MSDQHRVLLRLAAAVLALGIGAAALVVFVLLLRSTLR
jgi:hypothetical protein